MTYRTGYHSNHALCAGYCAWIPISHITTGTDTLTHTVTDETMPMYSRTRRTPLVTQNKLYRSSLLAQRELAQGGSQTPLAAEADQTSQKEEQTATSVTNGTLTSLPLPKSPQGTI